MSLILEGLVTTTDGDGALHLAPMGPAVDASFRRLSLRPFPSSRTYQNLRERPEGVFHVTDDALMLARAAVGAAGTPPHRPAERVAGFVLSGACRAYEFRVRSADATGERVRLDAEVVASHTLRDFFGFNRAKHAVVEAAILATRLHLLDPDFVAAEFARLRVPIDKTGGADERAALDFLHQHARAHGPAGAAR